MVTNEATGLCGGGLPASQDRLPQVVLVGQAGQPGQEIAEAGESFFAVALAGDDQRGEDGGALAGVGGPDEQPVFLADAGGAQGVLNDVVVESAFAVVQELRRGGPVGEQIIAGLAEGRLGQDALAGVPI